jgi:hypothetical protein
MSTADPFGLESDSFELPVNAVQQVEHALFRRALGVTVSKDALGRDGVTALQTELPGDVKAAQTFLAAYKPDQYGFKSAQLNVSVSLAADLAAARVRAGIIDGQCTDVTPRKLSAV